MGCKRRRETKWLVFFAICEGRMQKYIIDNWRMFFSAKYIPKTTVRVVSLKIFRPRNFLILQYNFECFHNQIIKNSRNFLKIYLLLMEMNIRWQIRKKTPRPTLVGPADCWRTWFCKYKKEKAWRGVKLWSFDVVKKDLTYLQYSYYEDDRQNKLGLANLGLRKKDRLSVIKNWEEWSQRSFT